MFCLVTNDIMSRYVDDGLISLKLCLSSGCVCMLW